MKCIWSGCSNEADPARVGSGPFDDNLCSDHDEIQEGDPPYEDPNPHINPTKERTN